MIHEVIVTTLSVEGQLHIAPMGIRRDDAFVYIAPFKPSTTLENLTQTRAAVVNYVTDVRIFAGCLTGRYDWPTAMTESTQGRYLDAALAHEELVVHDLQDDEQRPRATCRVTNRVEHRSFDGFNRAQGAVLEAAILVSRLDMLPVEKIDQEIEYLRIAIEKTAGPDETEAWEWLIARIDEHRNK